ncbi:MAG: carbon-nitrogen hydrolase family protein [Myxococcales bacterium]|nr:carbon-nitrogen hydrolase family protein [Myxococcales bacterium]
MSEHPWVAAAQMTSGADVGHNLDVAARLVMRGVKRGASLVVLPENVAFMGPEEGKLALAERFEEGEAPRGAALGRAMREVAAASRAWVLWGGVPEAVEGDAARVFNSAVMVSPEGVVTARYRKIHLFDVALADGTVLTESKTVVGGERLSVIETPVGRVGLSICYDVRFPELYRGLVEMGATVLTVPAAFTVTTGRDHWHVLLRARAIESQCYLVAAAQWGAHGQGRSTYGHAMVVDPWGTVVAECGDGEGLCMAEVSHPRLAQIRATLPSLLHRKIK